MNFLALCQRVASESGTINGTLPTAVTSQTGRLLKVVNWTAEAWNQIQGEHTTWKWMRAEFSGAVLTNTVRYTPASFNLTRHRAWITDEAHDAGAITVYATATGVSDETVLVRADWEDFRAMYLRGSQTAARPIEYAVSPAGELCFGPKPDAAYTAQGEYYKSAQTLSANSDTPECPEEHHMTIVWRALKLLKIHDEDMVQTKRDIDALHTDAMFALMASQLPRPRVGPRAPALA